MSSAIIAADKFPDQQLTVRRLLANDSWFKQKCRNHEDALFGLRYWRSAGPQFSGTAEEYRLLAARIERDIGNVITAEATRISRLAEGDRQEERAPLQGVSQVLQFRR